MDTQERTAWHTRGIDAVVAALATDLEQGLGEADAAGRLASHGANAIREGRRRGLLPMFAGQFRDFLVAILLVAAAVSGAVGEVADAITILVIVALNAVIGTIQEYRAEKAVAALRQMAAPSARVRREGGLREIPASELVPGDVVLLEAGNGVPADLRLVETRDLRVDESALTGESQVVAKLTHALEDPGAVIGDRLNMAYRGTLVAHGRGLGVVVETGMDTELGRIAAMLGGGIGQTPLQRRLARFGRRLGGVVLVIAAVLLVAGLARGEPLLLMFLTAVSLAVAAVPEALPAVVTIALALGARRMSRHHALMRRLPAVETLGSVSVICADKTGTLTQNRMRLERYWLGGRQRGAEEEPDLDHAGLRFAQALAQSNDATRGRDGGWQGDPTEIALVEAAEAFGMDRRALEAEYPRVGELPFDADRKRMTTLHADDDRYLALVKGAPEELLPCCRDRLEGEGAVELDRAGLMAEAESLADQGYRVLALACRHFEVEPALTVEAIETDLGLLGLVALIDPPREAVPGAVADCIAAGIRPVMITGDHPGTARAIAGRLGIPADDGVLTGRELGTMDDARLAEVVPATRVFARVAPEQKLRIVEILQARGDFVAMTGDGVNDAPALKRADIGVAMGEKGTDVAREAGDMVLLDDNFASIVRAVREGRRIYDNIRKFIRYTLTSNFGEILTLFLAPLLGMPLPLLPIQILWINLVTDGLPGLALSVEPGERGSMHRPPRPPEESVFARGLWWQVLFIGALIGGLSLLAQAWAIETGSERWQTMVFTTLTLAQMFNVMGIRSERESLFTIGILSNRFLFWAVLLTVGLQLMVIYTPAFNAIFHTRPLTASELAMCFGLASLVLVASELQKAIRRARHPLVQAT